MRYRESYQLTHDIDYFATYNGVLLHIASNGYLLPRIIDGTKNRELQFEIASSFDSITDVVINHRWVKFVRQKSDCTIDDYTKSFLFFAERGFVSLDTVAEYGKITLRIVAYPTSKSNDEKLKGFKDKLPKLDPITIVGERNLLRRLGLK